MPHVVWVHRAADPARSGELRRLAVPALAAEGSDLTCEVRCASRAGSVERADVVVLVLEALDVLPLLADVSASIIVEVDARIVEASAAKPDALTAASNRIAGVVARDPRAAAKAQSLVGDNVPVWLVPDCAAREVELAAAALRFGVPILQAQPVKFPPKFELWFVEPGDHVEAEEIEALARRWQAVTGQAVVIAPPEVQAWLGQSGVKASYHDWSPGRLDAAIRAADRCVFFGPPTFSHSRRVETARRGGGAVSVAEAQMDAAHDPNAIGAAWHEVLRHVARPRPSIQEAGSVLLLLDLIQDLDLALPLIDEFKRRPGVELRIVISSWLFRRSPRVGSELGARNLAFENIHRDQLESGAEPSLNGVAAVVAIAESSLPAHQRAHVLLQRARAARIPTFSFQHGVENVGLVHMEFENHEPPSLACDHLHVWFEANQTPDSVPPALRPRLVHTGRLAALPAPVSDLRSVLASFEKIVAVFENLHWARYSGTWRRQFLSDCVSFAAAHPRRAVMLKPHHGGLWSVRNNHLLPDWPPNLILADPTDPFWEPFTSTSLLQLADMVITTPSTVALDAVQAGKPVAVAAYGLDLPAYTPLPLLQSPEDWSAFAAQADSVSDARRRARFLSRTVAGEDAAVRAVSHLLNAARERAAFRSRIPVTRE